LRQAARTGEIEGLLGRFPLTAGEVYFVPPGTVHAIGAGLVLCEIQQNTDLTYRLYDYGRPRELHLEKAVECAEPGPHSGKSTPERLPDGGELLARCDYFATERWSLQEPAVCRWKPWTHQQLVVVEGAGWLGEEPFGTGDVWLIPPGEARTELRPSGSATLLCTYLPEPAA
jgi:mannose-6-phosphate isomerase